MLDIMTSHIQKSIVSLIKHIWRVRKSKKGNLFLQELLFIILLFYGKSSAFTETHRYRNSKGPVLIRYLNYSGKILSPFLLKSVTLQYSDFQDQA